MGIISGRVEESVVELIRGDWHTTGQGDLEREGGGGGGGREEEEEKEEDMEEGGELD